MFLRKKCLRTTSGNGENSKIILKLVQKKSVQKNRDYIVPIILNRILNLNVSEPERFLSTLPHYLKLQLLSFLCLIDQNVIILLQCSCHQGQYRPSYSQSKVQTGIYGILCLYVYGHSFWVSSYQQS